MGRTTQIAQVGKRKIQISNLEKVLFPDPGIIKAELIEYYLNVAPTLLRHIKGRPLTFVRYPDGVEAQNFFQKTAPKLRRPKSSTSASGTGRRRLTT